MPGWFTEWAESVNLLELILILSAISAAVSGVVLFVRKGWPWLKSFAKAILNTADLIDSVKGLPAFIERTDATLEAQDTKIAEIHHEVHYNNGSSVKDAVDRVERGVKAVYDELTQADAEIRRQIEDTKEP